MNPKMPVFLGPLRPIAAAAIGIALSRTARNTAGLRKSPYRLIRPIRCRERPRHPPRMARAYPPDSHRRRALLGPGDRAACTAARTREQLTMARGGELRGYLAENAATPQRLEPARRESRRPEGPEPVARSVIGPQNRPLTPKVTVVPGMRTSEIWSAMPR